MSEYHRSKDAQSLLRRRIIETAMTLFAQEGIKPVTMDRIAKELTISKRTLYEVLPDKETLLIEGFRGYRDIMHKRLDMEMERAENVMELLLLVYQRKMDELRLISPRFYTDLKKYPRVVAYMNAQHEEDMAGSVAFFKKGVEQGLFRADINYEVIHRVLSSQVEFILSSLMTKEFPLNEIFNSIILVCVRGFSTLEGQRIVDDYLKNQKVAPTFVIKDMIAYWKQDIQTLD